MALCIWFHAKKSSFLYSCIELATNNFSSHAGPLVKTSFWIVCTAQSSQHRNDHYVYYLLNYVGGCHDRASSVTPQT